MDIDLFAFILTSTLFKGINHLKKIIELIIQRFWWQQKQQNSWEQ